MSKEDGLAHLEQGLKRKWHEAVNNGGDRGSKLVERDPPQVSRSRSDPPSDSPTPADVVVMKAIIDEGLKGRFDDTDVAMAGRS